MPIPFAQVTGSGRSSSSIIRMASDAGGMAGRTLKPAQVMIIEDEPLVALELQLLVEDMGHKVCAVVDTEADALREAEATMPDLIIADIQLRQGNGVRAAERIVRERQVPVIFVSGNQTFTPDPKIHTTRFLAKPFRVDHLRQAVDDILSGGN